MYICCFVVVCQMNNNNCYTLRYCAKYGKFPDIYKQREKVFVLRYCFADYESTRLQDYEWLPPVLRYRFADYETASPQDYEWLPPWASLALRRRSSFEPASQTTSLQDNKPATAPLVVSLTSCLVVWRSNAKLNFRSSVVPTIALRQQCSKIKSISYSSNGLLSC